MTLYADDPDVHNTYPVTNKVGTDLTFEPVVAVSGYGDVDAEWVSAPGPQRDLKVPLYGLPAGVVMQLRLKVPDGNDLDLGRVTLIGTSLGSNPGPEPGGPVEWADITGKPATFPPAPHAHDDRYYTQAEVDDLLEGVAVGPASIDHGSVGSTLTISAAGSHELDLAGDLVVAVSTEGDVTLFVHGVGTVTVAGQEFEVDGEGIILVVTSPRGIQTAHMAGAASGGGTGGEVTPVEPTWDDEAQTFTVPSIAGVIYKFNGNTVTGTINAGEGEVTVTAEPAAGYTFPVGADISWSHTFGESASDLHSLLLSYNPPAYIRMSQGSLETFGTEAGTWTQDSEGSLTFDGPAIVPGATGSGKIVGSRTIDKSTAAQLNTPTLTIVAVCQILSECQVVHIRTASQYEFRGVASVTAGSGFEMSSPGGVHTIAWVFQENGVIMGYRDGVQWGQTGSWTPSRVATYLNVHEDWRDINLSHLMIYPGTLTEGQMVAIATAAGTVGNPR